MIAPINEIIQQNLENEIDLYDDDDSIDHGRPNVSRGKLKEMLAVSRGKSSGIIADNDDDFTVSTTELPKKVDFAAQREALRARIMQEVLDSALPDRENIDTELFMSNTRNEKGGFIVSLLKLFGCMTASLHDALMNGSIRQARSIMTKFKKDKEKGKAVDENMINALNEQGRSALTCAIILNRTEFIEFLLEEDADVNIPDEYNGMTALMYALSMKLEHKIIVTLITNGAELAIIDSRHTTPCMLAASTANDKALDLFLKHNKRLEPDLQDDNGWTALHHAAYGGNPKCCTLLLAQGADKMLKDKRGRRPLDIARFKDHGDCLVHLEDLKARIAFELGEEI